MLPLNLTAVQHKLGVQQIPAILAGHPAGAFWLLLRSFDAQYGGSSGKASFTIAEVMSLLHVSRSTVIRWMKQSLFYTKKEICAKYPNLVFKKQEKHILHKNRLSEKIYTLYYRSLEDVKSILKIESATCMRIGTVDEISKLLRKYTAHSIAIEYAQATAVKAATKRQKANAKKEKRGNAHLERNQFTIKKLLTPSGIFGEAQPHVSLSDKKQAKLKPVKSILGVKSESRRVLVDGDRFRVVGASQQLAGKITGRHRTTVSRYLRLKESKQLFVTTEMLTKCTKHLFNPSSNQRYLVNADDKPVYLIDGTVYEQTVKVYKEEYTNICSYDSRNTHKSTSAAPRESIKKYQLRPYKPKKVIRTPVEDIQLDRFEYADKYLRKRGILSEYDSDLFFVSNLKFRNKFRKKFKNTLTILCNQKVTKNESTEEPIKSYVDLLKVTDVVNLLKEYSLTVDINTNYKNGCIKNNGYTITNLIHNSYHYNVYISNIDNALTHHTITTDIHLFAKFVYSKLFSNSKFDNLFYVYLESLIKDNLNRINVILDSSKNSLGSNNC